MASPRVQTSQSYLRPNIRPNGTENSDAGVRPHLERRVPNFDVWLRIGSADLSRIAI